MLSAGSEGRPRRRTLLGQWLEDLLLIITVTLPCAVPMLMEQNTLVHHFVERVDVWQFDSLPTQHSRLRDWGTGQHDLLGFRVDVLAKDQIVLRYLRDKSRGVAVPDWQSLGYVAPRLLSTDTVTVQDPGLPRSGWGWSCILAGSFSALAVLSPRLNRAWRPKAPWNRPAARSWRLVTLVLLASVALDVGGHWLLPHEVAPLVPIQRVLPQLRGWAFWMACCSVLVVGPAYEEVLFRGCLLGRFRRHGYVASGVVLSAFAFSVAHGIPVLMPKYFCYGLILAWVCHRTGSLWPPLAVHVGWNVLASLPFVL